MPEVVSIPVPDNGSPDVQAVACGEQSVMRGYRNVAVFLNGFTVTSEQFMVELDRLIDAVEPYCDLSKTLFVGLHWRAGLSDDAEQSILRDFDPLVFEAMRGRADSIGSGALYRVVDALTSAALGQDIRFLLMGHSLGGQAVASCLHTIGSANFRHGNARYDGLLIQGAFANDWLEPGKKYENAAKLNGTLGVTHSSSDKALNELFRAATLFQQNAIGGTFGPSATTLVSWGERMISQDVTAWQAADPEPPSPIASTHGKFFGPDFGKFMGGMIQNGKSN